MTSYTPANTAALRRPLEPGQLLQVLVVIAAGVLILEVVGIGVLAHVNSFLRI
jgi:hypothetical protein